MRVWYESEKNVLCNWTNCQSTQSNNKINTKDYKIYNLCINYYNKVQYVILTQPWILMSLNLKDEVQTIIRSSIFPDNAICLQLLQEIKVIENTSKIF